MDVASQDIAFESAEVSISAAKMHVLGLGPIKNRLGDKWERLSDLVHKLFEKAISTAQGPGDHFSVLGELSYVVTFGNLSLAQTSLMCASIAREVCEHLFGNQIDEISVRNIVAEIVAPTGMDAVRVGAQIEAVLEREGIETIVTQSRRPGSSTPVTSVMENRQGPTSFLIEAIQNTHNQFAQFGLKLGLFPVWELRKGLSSSLFLTPYTEDVTGSIVSGKLSLCCIAEAQVIDIELGQLHAAAAYATRIRNENKICALGVGISYDSLSCLRSRIRYITALQQTVFSPSNPLLIRIEQIPDGAPDGRIAELVAMLTSKNVRITLEFQSLASIRNIDIRLGAVAIGGTIPSKTDDTLAMTIAERLVSRAMAQKAFAFLDHLDTAKQLTLANRTCIRFGRGAALGTKHFSGIEDIPNFPLTFG